MTQDNWQQQQRIHERALEIAGRFHRNAVELIEILQTLDAHKTFRAYECNSLFQYAVEHLGLSRDVALNFIAVARKAVEVPSLKDKIQDESITISDARKICSVITPDNQGHWLEKAEKLTTNQLEQEVATANPKAAVPEQLTHVTGSRLKLTLGVSQEFKTKLKRAQDLASQSTRSAASYERTLEQALDLFLNKRDPLLKAKRNANKAVAAVASHTGPLTPAAITCTAPAANVAADIAAGTAAVPKTTTDFGRPTPYVSRRIATKPATRRKHIAAQTNHQLSLRDQGRCAHLDFRGDRCENTRWLDRHHRIPVAQGGDNSIGNLVTLCSHHHQQQHL